MSNEKPFANYRPSPVISPWMYLYRRTGNPGVSNYYQFVRPRMNQSQLNTEIGNLQSASRTQSSYLQNLNQRTNEVRGNTQPQRYMNYNNYYPGFQR